MKRVLVVLVVGGCGGSSASGGDPIQMAEGADLCQTFATHATSCGWGGNIGAYDWNCGEALAVWREDAFREFVDCATALPCSGNGTTCDQQTRGAVTPLDYHDTYASHCNARVTECDLGLAMCDASTWELYTRSIVTQLTACIDKPCAEISACISSVL